MKAACNELDILKPQSLLHILIVWTDVNEVVKFSFSQMTVIKAQFSNTVALFGGPSSHFQLRHAVEDLEDAPKTVHSLQPKKKRTESLRWPRGEHLSC